MPLVSPSRKIEPIGGSRSRPSPHGLGFIPAQDEHYDFILPKARLARPAVQRFRAMLEDPVARDALTALGFKI